jgi:hypothetical protein
MTGITVRPIIPKNGSTGDQPGGALSTLPLAGGASGALAAAVSMCMDATHPITC